MSLIFVDISLILCKKVLSRIATDKHHSAVVARRTSGPPRGLQCLLGLRRSTRANRHQRQRDCIQTTGAQCIDPGLGIMQRAGDKNASHGV